MYDPNDPENQNPPTSPGGALGGVPNQQAPAVLAGTVDPFDDPDLVGGAPVDVDTEGEVDPLDINEHGCNIAKYLAEVEGETSLAGLINDIRWAVDEDEESLQPFLAVHAQTIEELGYDRTYDTRDDPFPGSSGVVNPILAAAAQDLSARIMAQFWPSSGPVRTEVIGASTPQKEAKADRKKAYLDLQLTSLIKNYKRQEDMLIQWLPITGTAFKKVFWNGREIQTQNVPMEDLIVPYHADSIDTAERWTHVIHMPAHELKRLQKIGFYREVPGLTASSPELNAIDRAQDRIQGKVPSGHEHDMFTLKEVHCLLQIDAIGDEEEYPYVCTYDDDSGTVLRISRDWAEGNEGKVRDECLIDYILIPFRGVYGISLATQIGGLARSATGALRALMDSALLANQLMGFRLKTETMGSSGNEIQMAPMEFAEIDAGAANVTDIRQLVMPLPFNGPNQTLFDLMKYVEDSAKTFASLNTQLIADSTNAGPVGTTYALIEESAKVFNSIFSRLHDSKSRELRIIHKLNFRYLDDQVTMKQSGGEMIVYRADFDDEVDIFPVSDPNISSTSQRVAQLGGLLQLAQQVPGVFDNRKLVTRAAEVMGVPDVEALLQEFKPDASPRDPVGNIQAIIEGSPVKAFPGQDPDSHLAFYAYIVQSPLYGANPVLAPMLLPPLSALCGSFLKLRLGIMAGHAITGNPTVSAPVGMTGKPLPIEQQNVVAEQMAQRCGTMLAADRIVAVKLGPIAAAAKAMIPPPPPDPLLMSAQAQAAGVSAKTHADIMQIVNDAAKIQSTERIAEFSQNQATDRAKIAAMKTMDIVPTETQPQGVLPQNVPDLIQQFGQQIWNLFQTLSSGAAPPGPQGPGLGPQGPQPGGPQPGPQPHPGPGPQPGPPQQGMPPNLGSPPQPAPGPDMAASALHQGLLAKRP